MALKRRKRKKEHPWQNLLVCIVMLAAVGMALYFGDTQPQSTALGGGGQMPRVNAEDPFDAVFVDVGQGACVILTSRGHTALIDAGETDQGPAVLDVLKQMGVQKLDLVIGTHAHSDHIGGLPDVLLQMNVDRLLLPAAGRDTTLVSQLEYSAALQGVPIEAPKQGEVIQLGDIRLTLNFSGETEDINETSIITKVEGPVSMLLTGDAGKSTEKKLIDAGYIGNVDILQVGHHGSSGSTGRALVEAAAPEYAVIQSGAGNSYGHPAAETLQRLYAYGIWVMRSDECGHIYVDADGQGSYTVSSEREAQQPYAAGEAA